MYKFSYPDCAGQYICIIKNIIKYSLSVSTCFGHTYKPVNYTTITLSQL